MELIAVYGAMAGVGLVVFRLVRDRHIIGNTCEGELSMLSSLGWPFFIPMWSVLLIADFAKNKWKSANG